MNLFMSQAIAESKSGTEQKDGGPFGAVIVRDGHIIARGHNMVLKENDPTAHAEIVAIRRATQKLQTFNLAGCEMYSSCEPCPMCCSAIHWARISKLYYAAARKDAARIGFDDERLYAILAGKEPPQYKSVQLAGDDQENAVKVMLDYKQKNCQLY